MAAGGHGEAEKEPPAWFARLIQPPVETTSIPISVAGRTYGQIVLTTEPSDEIAEVWEDFSDLLLIEVVAYFVLLGVLHLAVERALSPLSRMADAFETLEAGDYTARLEPIETPELRRLGSRFNLLAAALDKSIEERRRLSRRIISVQDRERRNISMELHDEFGPCLFGIKVEANAIARAAGDLPADIGPKLEQSARSILSIADHMHENNRLLLSRLRPMELGQLPLREVLNGMIKRFVGQSPDIEWTVALEIEDGEYDETVELTIYRVIQESVTNALRHSEPGHIAIRLEAANALVVDGAIRRFIRLTVADDGRGLSPETRAGTGLRGMRERVEGLGGRFELSSAQAKGTIVEALIPFPLTLPDGEQQASAEEKTR